MKHFRKVSAVLLAVLMAVVILPATGLLTPKSVPVVFAAEVGVVVNGDFSQYEQREQQQKDDGCGNMETVYYNHATGWEQNKWAVNITSGYANFSKDSSVANSVGLWQSVPVNTNATYKLTFNTRGGNPCYTYKITGTSQNGTVLATGTPSTNSYSYKTNEVEFNTGSHNYVVIQFICTGTGSSDSRLDDVVLSVVDSGDTGTHAAPSLKSFATDKNRPASDSDNIIVQPGFEDTTNAQWNTNTFITGPVSRVTDDAEGAHSGNAYLKYYRDSVALTTWPVFEITCPTAGEYVFSAWVRTPHLSSTNKGKASIGVIDRDTGKFLTYSKPSGDDKNGDGKPDDDDYYGHYSTPEIQIRSTATDDDWHLRSVVFYVGAANASVKIGMYGLSSTMYVDDISVHLLSKGVKYEGDQKGTLSASTSVSNKYCESEDNLIADCNMSGQNAVDFWSQTSGWNNGFLNFQQDPQSSVHGNALHYKGTDPGSNKLYNYIKWVYVEPNTSYTVSFDYRVAAAGNQLMFIDNNIESPQVFHTPSLGSASNTWNTYAFTFSTGNYNRIGIVLRDHASAELYLDDIRFFKSTDGIADEPEEEVFPTLKHNKSDVDYADPENPENKVLTSRMEMETGKLGLAFLFNLEATGVTRNDEFEGDYTNGKVQAFEDGVDYQLIRAGAVVTNKADVGQDEKAFQLANVQTDKTVIDVNAQYLYYNPDDYDGKVIHYGIRITNIPENHVSTLIYARPYYVFEYNGRQITVYGDIVSACYETFPDINDGWMEWD